jgi:hypothetical protein
MKKLIILLLLLPFFGCEKEAISQNKLSEKHYNVLALGQSSWADTAENRVIYSSSPGLSIKNNSKTITIISDSICNVQSKNCKKKLTEQQIIKHNHIDFTKEYISFVIHGLIEIDGHIFLNDTCKNPVIYESDLDGITILKNSTKYKHRNCNVKGCNIIHLEPINMYSTDPSMYQLSPHTFDVINHF